MLTHFGIVDSPGLSFPWSMIAHIIGVCAVILLLVGLCTPIVGALISMIELWAAMTHGADPWISIVLAALSG